jgi:hypothetical protein
MTKTLTVPSTLQVIDLLETLKQLESLQEQHLRSFFSAPQTPITANEAQLLESHTSLLEALTLSNTGNPSPSRNNLPTQFKEWLTASLLARHNGQKARKMFNFLTHTTTLTPLTVSLDRFEATPDSKVNDGLSLALRLEDATRDLISLRDTLDKLFFGYVLPLFVNMLFPNLNRRIDIFVALSVFFTF